METKFISNFLMVVRLGSMSEAARQLDLSPAAVAQQMRTLERDLGVELLVRHGRSTRPTAAGERLFEKARFMVQDWDNLRDWVSTDRERGQLRLGTVNTALHGFMPDVLQAFVANHPGVGVGVHVGTTPDLYAMLVQDELDVVVGLKPAFDLPKVVRWVPLRQEPLVVLCTPRDARFDPLSLLQTRSLVRYDRRLAGGKLADRFLVAHGLAPHTCLELNSVMAVALMVERGLGVGLVPDIGDALVQGRQLRKLPLPLGGRHVKGSSAPAPRELGVLWVHTSPRARWVQAFVATACQACPVTPCEEPVGGY